MDLSAIIILGPGAYPDGTMFLEGEARIEIAYQKYLAFKTPPYVILSGGKTASIKSEAAAMADYIQKQYPKMEKSLLLEELSIDTLQNAFFTKLIHIDTLKIKNLFVASNAFHIPRVKQIFSHLFDESYRLHFLAGLDPEADEESIKKQYLKEEKAMAFNEKFLFSENIAQNLENVYSFIFNLNPTASLAYKDLIKQFSY